MGNYKVYLADDERHIREGIAEAIPWEEHSLTFAGSGADGRAAYEDILRLRPDIVITDIKMPRMDGLELIRRVQLERSNVRFIVLSGYGEFELATQAMKFGVRHYLLKPSDEGEILSVLRDVTEELDERSFYHSRGTAADRHLQPAAAPDTAAVIQAVRSGDTQLLADSMGRFFAYIRTVRPEPRFAIARSLELLEQAAKGGLTDLSGEWLRISARFWQCGSLPEVEEILQEELSLLFASEASSLQSDKKTRLAVQMKQLAAEHLVDEKLTLQWLAQEHFYLHPEYLGKLFRQATGEKFSHYVTHLRVQRAKELIAVKPEIRMYEIAERCGFGLDPQYFSNVFKKSTGLTPLEYRKRFAD